MFCITLQRSVDIEKMATPQVCYVCELVLPGESSLKKHLSSEHWLCDTCGHHSASEPLFKAHLITHLGGAFQVGTSFTYANISLFRFSDVL